MVIAINTKYFLKAYQQAYSNFIYETFSRIAFQQPQHSFIFFSDAEIDLAFDLNSNISVVKVLKGGTKKQRSILYGKKIISLLKKSKADIFINTDVYCAMFTKASQCFIMHEPNYFFNSDLIRRKHLLFYKTLASFVLKKSKVIITDSQYSKNYFIEQYKIEDEKIDVIQSAVSDLVQPLDWQERQKIKDQHSDGNEYFVFIGDTSEPGILINLLKAFSHFKKWQKSSMQLFIIKMNAPDKHVTESLKLFRYRKDVKLLDNLPETEFMKFIAASYSFIYYPFYNAFEVPPLQAMKYNIPVIAGKIRSMPEACADAALYADFSDPANIAEKLLLVYKDENLRRGLIEKGMKYVENFNWDKAASLLWKSIIKATQLPITFTKQ